MTNKNNSINDGKYKEKNHARFKLTRSLANFFAKSYLFTGLLFYAALAIGIYALSSTAIKVNLTDKPLLLEAVIKHSDSKSSIDTANNIVAPIEAELFNIYGVKHVYSFTQEKESIISIEFQAISNSSKLEIINLIKHKILSKIKELSKRPITLNVKEKQYNDNFPIKLTLWSTSLDTSYMRTIALHLVQQLKTITGVKNASVFGGDNNILKIELNIKNLKDQGLSTKEVFNAIKSSYIRELSNGIKLNNNTINIRTNKELVNAIDVGKLRIKNNSDSIIYMQDIANIYYQPLDYKLLQKINYHSNAIKSSAITNNTAQAVNIIIEKEGGKNTQLTKNVLKEVKKLQAQLTTKHLNVSLTRDYITQNYDSVKTLIIKVSMVIAVIIALIWLNLGIKTAAIFTIIISTIGALSLGAFLALGVEINKITMLAILFAIGIGLNDIILVTSNTHKHKSFKDNISTMFEALKSSCTITLITIVAMIPMVFMGNDYINIYTQTIFILCVLIGVFSILNIFIFVPYFSNIFTSTKKNNKLKVKISSNTQNKTKFFRILIKIARVGLYRYCFIAILFLLMLASSFMVYNNSVTTNTMPLKNNLEFNVLLTNNKTTYSDIQREIILNKIIQELLKIQTIKAVSSHTETNKETTRDNLSQYYYQIKHKLKFGRLNVQLHNMHNQPVAEVVLQVKKVLNLVAKQTGIKYLIVQQQNELSTLPPIAIEVRANDMGKLDKFSNELIQILNINGILINANDISAYIENPKDNLIFHKNLINTSYIFGKPSNNLLAPIEEIPVIQKLLKKYNDNQSKEQHVSVNWSDAIKIKNKNFKAMFAIFLLMLVIFYLLLMLKFVDFITPLIIISPIPLAVIGIIPGHWLLSSDFNIFSIFGWMAIAIFIVRNAFLMVEKVIKNYTTNINFVDCVIGSYNYYKNTNIAGAVALIGGAGVMLSDSTFQSFAITVFFGILAALIMMLIVVPFSLLSAGERWGDRIISRTGLTKQDNQDKTKGISKTIYLDGINNDIEIKKINTTNLLKRKDTGAV